jgi:transcriptional regulator with XRE-family HTH domain
MTWQVMAPMPVSRYRCPMDRVALPATPPPVGELIRRWRQQRRWSQLDLAGEAEVSTRHLSCLETGRALPSREMLLRLAERLQVPLRERNQLLTAAGYAPLFSERAWADPALRTAHEAVQRVLQGHEPYPAMAVDRHWTLLASNRAVTALLAGLPAAQLQPPVNVMRLSLHPQGLAPRIVNLAEWREHLFERLAQQIEASGDPVLAALSAELHAYPAPAAAHRAERQGTAAPSVAVPLQLASPLGTLSFIGTITVFGTPVDVTLSELAIEAFFPADAATADALRRLVPPGQPDHSASPE